MAKLSVVRKEVVNSDLVKGEFLKVEITVKSKEKSERNKSFPMATTTKQVGIFRVEEIDENNVATVIEVEEGNSIKVRGQYELCDLLKPQIKAVAMDARLRSYSKVTKNSSVNVRVKHYAKAVVRSISIEEVEYQSDANIVITPAQINSIGLVDKPRYTYRTYQYI
jgi:hypothetical protein